MSVFKETFVSCQLFRQKKITAFASLSLSLRESFKRFV